MASTMTAIPISAHSTPLLPSQVTALTMPIATACRATRLFSRAAAPWSADSSGAHCSRTRTSRSAKTNAAAVTAASGRGGRPEAAGIAPLLPRAGPFMLFARYPLITAGTWPAGRAVRPRTSAGHQRRHAVHADHLVAGHLAAPARLRLQPDPAVGRHLPGPADHRVPGLGPAVRGPVRPVRGPGLPRGRRAADR